MNQMVLKGEVFERGVDTQAVTLLEGEFSPEDAKTHALGILGKSINHHWIQSFKRHENTGVSSDYYGSKMADLSLSRTQLEEFLEEAEKNGLKLNIEAHLKVSVA